MKSSSNSNVAFRNSGTLTVIIARLIATVSTFLLLHKLSQKGTELAGEFLWIYSSVFVLSALIRGGLELTVLKETSQHYPSNIVTKNIVVKSLFVITAYSLLLYFGVFIIFSTAGLANSEIANQGSTLLLKNGPTIYFCTIFFSMLTIFSSSLQGSFRAGAALTTLTTIPNIVFITLLSTLGGDTAEDLTYLYAISLLAALLITYFYWICNIPLEQLNKKDHRINSIKYLISSSLPFWVVICLNQYILNISSVLGFLLPPSEITIFAISFKLTLLISFVYMAINNLLMPKFSKMWSAGNFEEAKYLAGNCTCIILLIGVPIFIVIFILAPFILQVFGINDSQEGILVIRILALTQLVIIMTGSVEQMLNMSGHASRVRNNLLIFCFIGSIILIVLSTHFGVVGAATGISLMLISYNFTLALDVKKLLGINIFHFWKYFRMASQ